MPTQNNKRSSTRSKKPVTNNKPRAKESTHQQSISRPKQSIANPTASSRKKDINGNHLSTSDSSLSEPQAQTDSSPASSQDIDSDCLDSNFEEAQPPKKKLKSTPKSTGQKSTQLDDPELEPGRVAPFVLEFLQHLTKFECNDREWLISNDKLYRKALQNWKEFVEVLVPKLTDCDWTLPKLPSKDLIHRLHRDVRFSNDKTPYKKHFSAGFSRTGKKGPWASYYLHIQPGDKSLIAGGIWNPEKNELATIRNAIIRNSKPLRDVINHKEFVDMFGKPEQDKGKIKRQNIFGHDDELKNCPKMNGVDKSHPDIDLLKLRTIAAVKYFPDVLVLSNNFVNEILRSVKALCPLVQCINEMIQPQSDDEEE